MNRSPDNVSDSSIPDPPRGLALILLIGPALVWMGEAIGSGEVILSTRFGAIFGTAVLWVPALAIFLKYWIGMSGARYTVCTGEGMMDMFARMPGPRNWLVWLIVVVQTVAAAISTGGLAIAAGTFASALVPWIPATGCTWILITLAVFVVWSGRFDVVKKVMSLLILVLILGVIFVVVKTSPPVGELLAGLFGFKVPVVPQWALDKGVQSNVWHEIAPIMGWAAGGFASQVWYTYWVLGAGYGMARGRDYGQPADLAALKNMSGETAGKIRGWCGMVYADATTAFIIGIVSTLAFMIAGGVILNPQRILPDNSMALEIAAIFSTWWGTVGQTLFILAGWAALFSTLIGQLAGWPRLLSDGYRLCIPSFGRIAWKTQFRIFVLGLLAVNFIIPLILGDRPVWLISKASIIEGVLLIPLQALAIFVALYFVLPKMLSPAAAKILKPNPLYAVPLFLAAFVYLFFIVVGFIL